MECFRLFSCRLDVMKILLLFFAVLPDDYLQIGAFLVIFTDYIYKPHRAALLCTYIKPECIGELCIRGPADPQP
jgi:hypothetical protein